MTTTLLERTSSDDVYRMQWRGSDDGTVWSGWHLLTWLYMPVLNYNYYQARILINGEWRTSPVEYAGRNTGEPCA